jgi:hypothetical protein
MPLHLEMMISIRIIAEHLAKGIDRSLSPAFKQSENFRFKSSYLWLRHFAVHVELRTSTGSGWPD